MRSVKSGVKIATGSNEHPMFFFFLKNSSVGHILVLIVLSSQALLFLLFAFTSAILAQAILVRASWCAVGPDHWFLAGTGPRPEHDVKLLP